MVNWIFILMLHLAFATHLHGEVGNVSVASSIDEYEAIENQALKGTIAVTHDKKGKVDTNTFLLDQKPLKVDFVKDVTISTNPPLVISYYSFQIPTQPAGLYILPEVSVKVDGKAYTSVMSSYQVQAPKEGGAPIPKTPPPAQPAAQPSMPAPGPAARNATPTPSNPILRLEAGVEGPKPLYPGQKTRFVYQYIYNTNIDLVTEVLPLLDAVGFIKDGDKENKDFAQDGVTVSEVSQKVIAVKPGEYVFGPSSIEGYAYTTDSRGKHVYTSSKLTSEVPKVSVSVVPFPEQGKPASFNGAIGDFTFKVALLSSPKMAVGNEITLSIDISGKGDLTTLKLPEICCQPGISGFFRMSDLPPVGTIQGDVKNFVVHMRPLNANIKEIPSYEFSFFNPEKGTYQIAHSEPIPIEVQAVKSGAIEIPKVSGSTPTGKKTGPVEAYRTKPIEIQGAFKLASSDLYNRMFGTWWSLAMIPFGVALLIYQRSLKDYLELIRSRSLRKTDEDLLTEALQQPRGSSQYFEMMNRALRQGLADAGFLQGLDSSNERFTDHPIAKEVRQFLIEVEENRFSGKQEIDYDKLEGGAKSLLKKIHNEMKT